MTHQTCNHQQAGTEVADGVFINDDSLCMLYMGPLGSDKSIWINGTHYVTPALSETEMLSLQDAVNGGPPFIVDENERSTPVPPCGVVSPITPPL